ncbi:LysM peptidoglycan-binding domain-containing protein [Kribbella sp. NPDC051587]|uniref:LysM peptidoglycan-binding domain-containing protein n=1 Tax=Kribbella sp. NPDC051587 TaxID=3364119 RepID=UPI003793EB92
MIRAVKSLLSVGALVGVGLALRWMTTGTLTAMNTHDLDSLTVLAVGAVAWVAYAWLVLAVLATALEQLPGAIGTAAGVVATRITSTTSRALLRSALGVAAVTPLTVGVAHAASPHTWTAPQSTTKQSGTTQSGAAWRATEPRSTVQLSGDTWRATEPQSSAKIGAEPQTGWRSTEPQSSVKLSGNDWRATEPRSTVQPGAERVQDLPPRNAVRTGLPKARPAQAATGDIKVPDRPESGAATRYTDLHSGRGVQVTVKAGDTLWDLAARELGPHATNEQIAERWPHWYAANRQVIGTDPNLILPGQVLRAPAQATPPTKQEQ